MSNETRIRIAAILANKLKASRHEDSIFVPVQMLTKQELYDIADEIIRGISQ